MSARVLPPEDRMRRLVFALTLLTPVAFAEAQIRHASRDVVPSDVQGKIEERWNGRNEIRTRDSIYIARDSRPVEGNIAVQNGPLVLGGRINGNVLAVNSDVILRPGARVDGDLLIVGGRLRGKQNATIRRGRSGYREPVESPPQGEKPYSDN